MNIPFMSPFISNGIEFFDTKLTRKGLFFSMDSFVFVHNLFIRKILITKYTRKWLPNMNLFMPFFIIEIIKFFVAILTGEGFFTCMDSFMAILVS